MSQKVLKIELSLLISLLFAISSLQNVLAQEKVELLILDQKTEKPIEGVYAAISKDLYLSNPNGKIQVAVMELPQKIQLSHISYKSIGFVLRNDTTIYLTSKTPYLDEVQVRAFESLRPILEQDAAVSFIDKNQLRRFNETQIVNAVNTMPGVSMEERAPMSFRISIRGSALRSPFGVRNVKIYWNDLPFTEPNGVTFLNLLDFSNIDEIEVLKGPSGSIFGAGTGGVIQLRSSEPLTQDEHYSFGVMAGSFGTIRADISALTKFEKSATDIRLSHQESQGFRDHSASERQTFQINHQLEIDEKNDITFSALFSSVDYQIPGGLNAEEFLNNPRAARANSAEQNAGILHETIYLAVKNKSQLNEDWSNRSLVYASFNRFDNPFITDYKQDQWLSWGARTVFERSFDFNWASMDLTTGAEYSQNITEAINYGNVLGQRDSVRFSDMLNVAQAFAFGQADWSFGNNWRLSTALSLNFVRYQIDRIEDRIWFETGIFTNTFSPQLVPRLALWKGFGDFAWHASVSSGFSPPTLTEVRTNEGSINRDLMPERGLNYETGFRWWLWNKRVFADATFFYFQLSQTITTETNEDGVVLFLNAGATNQWGTEWQITSNWLENFNAIQLLSTQVAYTGHFFNFADYNRNGQDFSGNQLTGVAPHYVSALTDIQLKKGFYANLTYQYSDAIPLNDANSVFADPYHLFNFRTGYRRLIAGKIEAEIFAGVDNLLDEVYSLGNDLNAFGGRFFQPAAGRNYYGGLKLIFNKSK